MIPSQFSRFFSLYTELLDFRSQRMENGKRNEYIPLSFLKTNFLVKVYLKYFFYGSHILMNLMLFYNF